MEGFELGKDPKHDNKADDEIIWVSKVKSFLPEEFAKDALATKIKMLISIVKEDHAKYSYKKEMKHYAPMIIDILKHAKKNGYNVHDIDLPTIDEVEAASIKKVDGKWDDIVDG
jgi:hypothetical protein